MKLTKHLFTMMLCTIMVSSTFAQDYFLKNKTPFNTNIPSPEAFLGYPIGTQHTRHDQIVAYLTKLAKLSDRASITTYGETHEHRKLVILTVTTSENLNNLDTIKAEHLKFVNPNLNPTNYNDRPHFCTIRL